MYYIMFCKEVKGLVTYISWQCTLEKKLHCERVKIDKINDFNRVVTL